MADILSEQKKALDARKKIKMFESYTTELSWRWKRLRERTMRSSRPGCRDVLAKKYTKFIRPDLKSPCPCP